jgi:hypothetical protein
VGWAGISVRAQREWQNGEGFGRERLRELVEADAGDVESRHLPSLDFTTGMTIEAWIYPASAHHEARDERRNTMGLSLRFGVNVLMLASMGCAPSSLPDGGIDAIPDRAQLERRIAVFAAALFAGDQKAQYEMQTPYLREGMTLDDWKRDSGPPEDLPRLKNARLAQVHTCGDYEHPAVASPLFRCVLSVEVVLIDQRGQEQSEELGQMWEYQEGQWYFGFPLH